MPSRPELLAEAKSRGLKGYTTLKKADLQKLLDTPPPKPPRGVPRGTKAKAKAKPAPKKESKEPSMFGMWDTEVQNLWKKTKGKLPKKLGDKVLYYHDFNNTDQSTTLSKRKTKNYDIPTYVRPDDGYDVGNTRWRDYSWHD